jgi:hypothetical protein
VHSLISCPTLSRTFILIRDISYMMSSQEHVTLFDLPLHFLSLKFMHLLLYSKICYKYKVYK